MPSGQTLSGNPVHWQEDSGEFCKIVDFFAGQRASAQPGYIVQNGESFYYKLILEFTPILGTIAGGVDITVDIYAHDLSSGGVQTLYTKNLKKDLKAPRDDDKHKTWDEMIDGDFNVPTASVSGTFLIFAVVTVPTTGLACYTYGPLLQVF